METVFKDTKGWFGKYAKVKKSLPAAGTILRAVEGPVKLTITALDGQRPVFKAAAYVNDKYGVEPKWVVRGMSDRSLQGLKCLILEKSTCDFIEALGDELEGKAIIAVDGLRVVREGSDRSCVLCEIVDGRLK